MCHRLLNNVPTAAGQPRDSAEGGGSAQQESQDVCKVQVQEQTPVIASKTSPMAIVSRQTPVIAPKPFPIVIVSRQTPVITKKKTRKVE